MANNIVNTGKLLRDSEFRELIIDIELDKRSMEEGKKKYLKCIENLCELLKTNKDFGTKKSEAEDFIKETNDIIEMNSLYWGILFENKISLSKTEQQMLFYINFLKETTRSLASLASRNPNSPKTNELITSYKEKITKTIISLYKTTKEYGEKEEIKTLLKNRH